MGNMGTNQYIGDCYASHLKVILIWVDACNTSLQWEPDPIHQTVYTRSGRNTGHSIMVSIISWHD